MTQVPSPSTELSPAPDSPGRRLRLVLAFLAFSISFTLVLRTHFVPMGDLYSRWYGIQQLLRHGRNPYGTEVNREIEVAFYGHILQPGEGKDEQRFAYPIYVVVLLWPMAFMKYSTVSAIALPLLIAAAAAFTLACTYFVDWPTNRVDQLSAVLFGLSTTPMLRGLRIEQLSTVVALFLMAAFIALSKRQFVIAGILLAFSAIKPQMALLPILWAVVWAISKWQERKKLLLALAAMALLFLVVGQALLPGWLRDFFAGLPAYSRYAGSNSFLTMVAGEWGLGATAILGLVGLWAMHSYRKASPASRGFQFTTALILALAAVAMPAMAASHNQILMFPAAFLLLRDARRFAFNLTALFAVILSWTPVMALATWLSGRPDFMFAAKTAAGVVIPLILIVILVRYATRLRLSSFAGEDAVAVVTAGEGK